VVLENLISQFLYNGAASGGSSDAGGKPAPGKGNRQFEGEAGAPKHGASGSMDRHSIMTINTAAVLRAPARRRVCWPSCCWPAAPPWRTPTRATRGGPTAP
jgi:hypothetical protein